MTQGWGAQIVIKNIFLAGLLFFVCLQNLYAENWPCWRGPRGDGTSIESNIPVRWDADTNVLWKTPVPGTGHASPIVWQDYVFTASALKESQEKILLCFDRHTGVCRWQRTVLKTPFEKKHNDNSFASGTPATDGKYVYVSFMDGKEGVLAAYDFDGSQVWLARLGIFDSPHGYACSPVLYEDKVIINGSSNTDAFVAALKCIDGSIVWKIPLEKQALSFSTPIVRPIEGRSQLLFCGGWRVAAYNVNNGDLYWLVDGPSQEFCASPVFCEKTGLVYISSSWPQRHLLAIKPTGDGNVADTHIAWRTQDGAYYVPSPVIVGDYLFTTSTAGEVHCFKALDGMLLWKEKLGKQYASPVTAGGLVYMPNDDGVITVIKPGPAFNSIAQNAIGEKMFASPAVSDGRIFLRTEKSLVCIGGNNKP